MKRKQGGDDMHRIGSLALAALLAAWRREGAR